MKYITKIKLQNFKRFESFEVILDSKMNIIIGENEAGKSSILSAINLVLGGSRSKVESIGFEKLINTEVVENFLKSDKKYEDLPVVFVEIYLNEQDNFKLNGKNNSDVIICDGLQMVCCPNDELSSDIQEILNQSDDNFPYEYYTVRFTTFQGDGYTGYRKFLRHILLDTSLVSSDYAAKEYVSDMYGTYIVGAEKNKHQNEYRKLKEHFKDNILSELNSRVEDYSFSLKNDNKTNLVTDLTLVQDNVAIENKGRGTQCFIKTEFALKRAGDGDNKIDIALIEEPENHLSHINMKKLIGKIGMADDKQLIIATHNNLISARLDLRRSILLHSSSIQPVLMSDLPEDTATFFMKAPDNNVLDFILSNKVILVEGDAEYILMEDFFNLVTGEELKDTDVHILSVGGTSFKRYLDIAKLHKIRTAVIRDNDGDFQPNCVDSYSEYAEEHISVFFDSDNNRKTFEVCIYQDNTEICEELFSEGRRTLSVQEYMLANKTEAAFELLLKKQGQISIPEYIKEAIEWIR